MKKGVKAGFSYGNGRFHGYQHKREGWYRKGELRIAIERRFGIELPLWKMNWWIRQGLIPAGDEYGPAEIKGTTSIRRVYSDLYAEMIIGYIATLIRSGELQ